MREMEAYLETSQRNVTGTVELTLRPLSYTLVVPVLLPLGEGVLFEHLVRRDDEYRACSLEAHAALDAASKRWSTPSTRACGAPA